MVLVAAIAHWGHAADPSHEEQYWLELTNRFRADPVAELDRLVNYDPPVTGSAYDNPSSDDDLISTALTFFDVKADMLRDQFNALTPAPPLAWSNDLHDSALRYASFVIDASSQDHSLDGLDLIPRIRAYSDYTFSGGGSAAENLFAFTRTVLHGHSAYVIDWGGPTGIQAPPGHRDALINNANQEIGIALVPETNSRTEVGPFVNVQHLAVDYAIGPFLTGVTYEDADQDRFYSIGEGLDGLTVEVFQSNGTASNPSSSPVATTTTSSSGGYRIELSPGIYNVRFTGPSVDQTYSTIDFTTGQNVKLDAIDPAAALLVGDINRDSAVNNLDITAFITALSIGGRADDADAESLFLANVHGGRFEAADVNMDLHINNLDITLFVDLLSTNSTAAASRVPEPMTVMSLISALLITISRRPRP